MGGEEQKTCRVKCSAGHPVDARADLIEAGVQPDILCEHEECIKKRWSWTLCAVPGSTIFGDSV